MKVFKKAEVPKTGKAITLYGEAGVGKTVSILQGAPDPIAYVQAEPRSLAPSLEAIDRPDLDLEVFQPEGFEDLKQTLAHRKNFERHATIVVDSFSHLMNIDLSREIEDETFDARKPEDQKKKPLVSQAKMTEEGYGGLASQMFRVTQLLCQYSTLGKVVIATARVIENPKWDRALAAAPALKGRLYPANMAGFFDLIGYVKPRVNKEKEVIYPPFVTFESPDNSFVAKFSGVGKKQGPLMLDKILK